MSPLLSHLIRAGEIARSSSSLIVLAEDGAVSATSVELLCSIAGKSAEVLVLDREGWIQDLVDPPMPPRRQVDSKEVIPILQPDWTACGSASTFDLVAKIIGNLGYLPISIRVAIRPVDATASFGLNFAHQTSSSWSGIQLRVGVGRLKHWREVIKWMVRGRWGLIDWQSRIYTSARIPSSYRRLLRVVSIARVYVNHVFLVGLADRLMKKISLGDVSYILDTHDIQSVNNSNLAALLPFVGVQPNFPSEFAFEVSKILSADHAIFVTDGERETFVRRTEMITGQKPDTWTAFPLPRISTPVDRTIARTASSVLAITVMANNEANRRGLSWFLSEVAPLVHLQQLRMCVLGDIAAYSNLPPLPPWIEMLGRVEDVGPWYERASVAVLPVVTGSGIAIKTLEVMTYGVPLVATSHALRGLPHDEILKPFDSPQLFAEALTRILVDPLYASGVVAAGEKVLQLMESRSYESVLSAVVGSQSD